MKNEKKLALDQERLVRLQDAQLDATAGGADGNGSTTIVVDVPILGAADDRTGGGDARVAANDGSCCNKSC